MKQIKRITLMAVLLITTLLQGQTKVFNSQVRIKQVPLSSSLDSLVTINSDGLLTYLAKSDLASGGALEFITEGGNTGIAIKGRNPDNYGEIGNNAVDLSFSGVSSAINGATGSFSTSLGVNTVSSGGNGSLSVGQSSLATGLSSFAEGNSTTASGNSAHSQGINTIASGRASIVGGDRNFSRSYAETSLGSYGTDYTPLNTESHNPLDRLFNLGNGVDGANRSDALTVYKSGNATLNGDLTVDNIIGNGSQLTNVDASTLNGLSQGSFVGRSTNVNSTNGVVTSASDNTIAFAVNGGGSTGFPTEFGSTVHFNLADMERDFSLFKVKGGDRYYLRGYNNNNTSNEWRELYHSGNFDPSSKLDVDGNGSQLTNVAKLNQSNTFTETQNIRKGIDLASAINTSNGYTLSEIGTAKIPTIFVQRGTGALVVGYGVKAEVNSSDYYSSTSVDLPRSALITKANGAYVMIAPQQDTAVGDVITGAQEHEIYHSGNSAPVITIDTSTLQTSSTLNSSFPFADNPDGTIVVNKDNAQSFMYIRVSSQQWKAVSLGSTI